MFQIEGKPLWPVVYITNSKHVLIGIPIMKKSDRTKRFDQSPEIPATIQLLDTFGNFLKELSAELSAENSSVC